MRFAQLLLLPLFIGVAVLPVHAAPPATNTSTTPAPRQVRFDAQISRVATTPAAATPDTPIIVGAPTIATLDRNTASVSVIGNGSAYSYNLALSPTIENTDNAVQVLWNLRLSGKDLPDGTASFTLTGAMRLVPGTDTQVGEMTLTDLQTGKTAVFRLKVRATLDSTASAPSAPAATN